MDLALAIRTITAEYVVSDGHSAEPSEVVWDVRAALTVAKLNPATGVTLDRLIEAYRTVLDAREEDLTQALQ